RVTPSCFTSSLHDALPISVEVRGDGTERLGEPVAGADAAWLARWWPLGTEAGLRAEIGLPRDRAWAAAAGTVARGLAVAVDYAQDRKSTRLNSSHVKISYA